jgi:hypothetical protein
MPQSTELPPKFGNFAYLNAAEVATGRDFGSHVERLVAAIDRTVAGDASGTPHRQSTDSTQANAAAVDAPAHPRWSTDTLRYFAVPLLLLLVAHHLIVNAFNLDTIYLQSASAFVPFVFGFVLFWMSGRGAGAAVAFAVALGVIGVAGMTVSQSLNSGDPIVPQTRFEWWDNINYATIIAPSYLAGHVLARALRACLNRVKVKL